MIFSAMIPVWFYKTYMINMCLGGSYYDSK